MRKVREVRAQLKVSLQNKVKSFLMIISGNYGFTKM